MHGVPTPFELNLAAEKRERPLSPWRLSTRLGIAGWECCWAVFCGWTPKPCNGWRLLWLRAFGARIFGTPFVHQRARIQMPWKVTLHDRCCLGDRANVYALGEVEIGAGAVIAQEAYLCTGTHDFTDAALPLVTRRIVVGADAFVGARAFVLPGVTIGAGAIIGACAVVTRDVAAGTVNAGNPARCLGRRSGGPESRENAPTQP